MSAPLLSICIPTFNREAYLRDCLESLKGAWVSDVEIVVSDNASTDGTTTMLETYALYLPLRWQRQQTNLGFDLNCASVVSMARGRYCWLLGSDDCIMPDSLEKAMTQLRQHDPDIFHFGYVQADLALRPLSRSAPPAAAVAIKMTPTALPGYFEALPNVSLLFAFISSFIFRRESWLARRDRLPDWLGSHYVHAYMLHTMLAAGATVLSSSDCLVIARGGNPNPFNSSPGKLLALDAVTLQRIHREIFHETLVLKALGHVFRRSYNIRTFVSVAAHGGVPQLISCYSALTALGVSSLLIRLLQVANWFHLMPGLKRLISLHSRVRHTVFAVQSPSTK